MRLLSIILALVFTSCSNAAITSIGPRLNPRAPDCDIEVLEMGKTPGEPYRDVGMVALKNCPDYQSGPCRKWLVEAACSLGGHVVYTPTDTMRDGRPDNVAGAVTVTMTVGAYMSTMMPEKDDPVLNSTPMTKGCEEVTEEQVQSPEDQMCTE